MSVRVVASSAGYRVEVDGHFYDASAAQALADRIAACARGVLAKQQAEAALTMPLRVAAYLERAGRASAAVIAAGLRVDVGLVQTVLLTMVADGTAEPMPACNDATVYRIKRRPVAAAS